MYKVLIVDDEPFILDGLRHVIDWEEHGLEIAATARNGIEALGLLENSEINIMITDVKMPKMDGLELIRNIKSRGLQVKIIILSGYDEFEYAKEAIRLGIENYLLKPVSEDEFSSTLLTIIDKIDAEQQKTIAQFEGFDIIKGNILNRWVIGTIADIELQQRAEMVGIKLENSFYLVCLIKKPEHSMDTILKQFSVCNICYKTISKDNNNIAFNNLNGDTVIVFSSDENGLDYQSTLKLLGHCINNIKTHLNLSAQAYAGSIEQGYRSVSKSYENAITLAKHIPNTPPSGIIDWYSVSKPMPNMLDQSHIINNCSPLIRKVINHVSTRYSDEISLKTLSAAFNISPAYLGRIFKLETSEMFSNYLCRIRIEKAKTLLIDTELRASKIAEKVGYSSPNYFYNAFKKFTGLYPAEYRKTHQVV